MWTHHNAANRIRQANGASPLPAGPKFSRERAIEIQERHRRILRRSSVDVEATNQNGDEDDGSTERGDVDMDLDVARENDRNARASRNALHGLSFAINSSLQGAGFQAVAPNLVVFSGNEFGTQNQAVVNALEDLEDSDGNDKDADDIGGSAVNINDSDDEDDIVAPGSNRRAIPHDRFVSWVLANKKWVSMAVDFNAKQSIMQRVLTNINAPYDTWKTVLRNVANYSGLVTTKYLCCRSHELFIEDIVDKNTDVSSLRPDCTTCSRLGISPEYGVFEYIHFLPRLQAWTKNVDSASMLFDYLHEHCFAAEGPRNGVSDFFDGSLFKQVVATNGGATGCAYDIFLSLSTDGFQVFRNNSFDCWPIAALILNLPPNARFLMRNVLVLGFLGDKSQPTDLESFIRPFVNELAEINRDGGTPIILPDGSEQLSRVHLLWCGMDMQGQPKLAGTNGPSAKQPCLHCEMQTVYLPGSRRYYMPSVVQENTTAGAPRYVNCYSPSDPKLRIPEDNVQIMQFLAGDGSGDLAAKQRVSKETGIKRPALLFTLPSMVPYHSFPVDTMHLGYNICKDLMTIFKGENKHLLSVDGYLEEDIVVSAERWNSIDKEMRELGKGTSQCMFGSRPRDTTVYRTWKASEYRQFVLNFWLVLLDGHLPPRILQGLRLLSLTVELWSRPRLSSSEIEDLGKHSVAFFEHFEENYFRYRQERVGLCKLTLHTLIHLKECTLRCGPLVNCSQFWVERFIEFTKSRLNARAKAARSMTESAKMFEGYKLLCGEHFVLSAMDDDAGMEGMDFSFAANDGAAHIRFKGSGRVESLSSAVNSRLHLRTLLRSYIMEAEDLDDKAAEEAVWDENVVVFGGADLCCGAHWTKVGALSSGRKRTDSSRGNVYVAAEFEEAGQSGEGDKVLIYYGRVFLFLEYTFAVRGQDVSRRLFVADWAYDLRTTEMAQVYCDAASIHRAFKDKTVADVSAMHHMIGVVAHAYPPAGINLSQRRGRKVFFLDPLREFYGLLDDLKSSVDGVNRSLGGVARRGRRRKGG